MGFVRLRQIGFFWIKLFNSENLDIPCFRTSKGRGGRCTKFAVNQTNIKRVILEQLRQRRQVDLTPEISLTSADARPDVTMADN